MVLLTTGRELTNVRVMDVPVNYTAIAIAAVANMVLGFLWYGPVFGKYWVALSGWTKADIEKGKKEDMTKNYVIQAAASLVMSYVLAHSLIFASTYMNVSGIAAGLSTGFWSFVGFVMPVTLTSVLWEGKPWKLWLLNASYYLVTLLLMGAILASF